MSIEHEQIAEYAERWGVRVYREPLRYSQHEDGIVFPDGSIASVDVWQEGPGDWSLVFWPDTARVAIASEHDAWKQLGSKHSTIWPFLLHELAHAVCPKAPEECSELLDTMGFEILSVLHLGLDMSMWEHWQAEYALSQKIGAVYASGWTNAPPMWRRRKMIRACDQSRAYGLFIGGKPTFRIPPREAHG